METIGRNFYLLRSREKDFHRNIYIKVFQKEDSRLTMIMDPGTKMDLEMIVDALKELAGGVENLDIIFLSHQDPDVSANVAALLSLAPKALVISSVDTLRLIKMYGVEEKKLKGVEPVSRRIITLKKTGHKIQFVPAYFCHFRGSMMFFDLESRILYSGDFLAGFNSRKGEGVYANSDSWKGISLFHQIYMPTRGALQETVARITLLNPMPEIIAPQHGDVIKGELVFEFLNKISRLEVGLDLMRKFEPEKKLLSSALNDFLERLGEKFPFLRKKLMQTLKEVGNFTPLFVFSNGQIEDIKVSTRDALEYVWNTLERLSPLRDLEEIRGLFGISLEKFGLTPPSWILEEVQEEELFEL